MMGDTHSRNLQPKKNPITDEYRITNQVLGLGINGKVVECFAKSNGGKFALKVSDQHDLPTAWLTMYILFVIHTQGYVLAKSVV